MKFARGIDSFDALAEAVEHDEDPTVTGRALLRWVGAERRGARVIGRIHAELRRRNLTTEPGFADVWVDVPLHVKVVNPTLTQAVMDALEDEDNEEEDSNENQPDGEPVVANAGSECTPRDPVNGSTSNDAVADIPLKALVLADAVHRIGLLSAANKPVDSVSPGSLLKLATTKMMMEDYSQLPIIQGEWTCKGAVSWQSIAEAAALGKACEKVEDCSVSVEEVPWNAPLLDVIPKIVDRGFVLVRGQDNRFQGIVTVADLSLQFRALSEPFLLLGQIENLLRILIERSFTIEEIRSAKNSEDTNREVNSVFDLNFGGYVRLLERPESWVKLKVPFDRLPFIKRLEEIRVVRNEVMHFDPDPLVESDLVTLRQFTSFLQRVV